MNTRGQIGTHLALRIDVPAGQAPLVLGIFFVTQVLDGLLTFEGISRFGDAVEANILVHTVVSAWGAVPGLTSTKAFACACGLILYGTGSHRLLAAATGANIGIAIIPWLLVLMWN